MRRLFGVAMQRPIQRLMKMGLIYNGHRRGAPRLWIPVCTRTFEKPRTSFRQSPR